MKEHRVTLISEELLESLVATQMAADDRDYCILWGEPHTEVVTYYEPTISTAPKAPPIEIGDDG